MPRYGDFSIAWCQYPRGERSSAGSAGPINPQNKENILKRVATVMMATLALMSVVFVAVAAGHTAKFDTTVTAKFNKPNPKDPYATGNFDGTVASKKARCQKNRKVTLLTRAADGSSTAVGTDLTDANGAWLITSSSTAPGTYFAKVAKKVLRKSTKHRHICKKAVSKDVTVK